MNWLVFLGILNISVANYCKTDNHCIEEMIDCILDGESFDWCSNNKE